MRTVTDYIPMLIFLAIFFFLVWAGFSRTDRIRAKAAAQTDAYLAAMNRNADAAERIAAALEVRNQNGTASKSN